MADFLQSTDLGSDTDDEDYAPELDEDAKKVLSEEEEDGVGEEGGGTKSKKKKTKKKAEPAARGSIFEDKDESAEDRKKEFEKEKEEIKEEQEKKKVEDLWAAFKKDTSTKPKPKSKPAVKKPPTSKPGVKKATVGGSSAKPKSTISDLFEPKKPAEENSKATDGSSAKPKSILSDLFAEKKDESKKPAETEEKPKEKTEEHSDPSKIKVTQVFDFAGESVKVTKELDKDSKEAKKILKQNPDAASGEKRPATGGLAAMMDSLTKKKKMGCLDKSSMDWKKFVDKEGLKEDLETHNKGKDGYVNKQTFLEEVDLRRFEKEKEAREKTRKTLNR